MQSPNFIADTNPFQLAGPPEWFLRQLWDFDSSLVIVPSRQGFYYRLAQRRKLNLPAKMVNDILFQESDTQMLATYGLVPVTTILSTANWSNPLLFQDLASRAPHRMGGSQKAISLLEGSEAKEDLRKAAQQDEMLHFLAKDGWGMYQKNIGVRSHMYVPRTARSAEPSVQLAPSVHIPKVSSGFLGRD
jgi:hypothetical protein